MANKQDIKKISDRVYFDPHEKIILPILELFTEIFKKNQANNFSYKFDMWNFSTNPQAAEIFFIWLEEKAELLSKKVKNPSKNLIFDGEIAYDLEPKYKKKVKKAINEVYQLMLQSVNIPEESHLSNILKDIQTKLLLKQEHSNLLALKNMDRKATKQRLNFVDNVSQKPTHIMTSCKIKLRYEGMEGENIEEQLYKGIGRYIKTFSSQDAQDQIYDQVSKAEGGIKQFVNRVDTLLINYIKKSVNNDIIEKIIELQKNNISSKKGDAQYLHDFQELFNQAKNWESVLEQINYVDLDNCFFYEFCHRTWTESFPFLPDWGDFIGKSKKDGVIDIVVPFALKMGSYGVLNGKSEKSKNPPKVCNLQNRFDIFRSIYVKYQNHEIPKEKYDRGLAHMLFSLGAYSPTIHKVLEDKDQISDLLNWGDNHIEILKKIKTDINDTSNKIHAIKQFVFEGYKKILLPSPDSDFLKYTKYLNITQDVLAGPKSQYLFKSSFFENPNGNNFLQLSHKNIILRNTKTEEKTNILCDYPITITLKGVPLYTKNNSRDITESINIKYNPERIMNVPCFFAALGDSNKLDYRLKNLKNSKSFYFKFMYLIFFTLLFEAIAQKVIDRGQKPYFHFFNHGYSKKDADSFTYQSLKIFESLFNDKPLSFAGSQTISGDIGNHKPTNAIYSMLNNYPVKIFPKTGISKNWGMITLTATSKIEKQSYQPLRNLLYGDSHVFMPLHDNQYQAQPLMFFAEPKDLGADQFDSQKVTNIIKQMSDRGINDIIILVKMLITQSGGWSDNDNNYYYLNHETLKKYKNQGGKNINLCPLFMSEYRIADTQTNNTKNCLYIDDTERLFHTQNGGLENIYPLFTLINNFVISPNRSHKSKFYFKTAIAYNAIQVSNEYAHLYNISEPDKKEILKILSDYHILKNHKGLKQNTYVTPKIQPHQILNKKHSFMEPRIIDGFRSCSMPSKYKNQQIQALCLMQELKGLLFS